MALIRCYECEREISDKASVCPQCGAPVTALPTSEVEPTHITPSAAPSRASVPTTKTFKRSAGGLVGGALAWVFGLLFLVIGAASILDSPMAGIICIALALILLPPVTALFRKRTGIALSHGVRAGAFIVLFMVFGFVAPRESDKSEQKAKLALVTTKNDSIKADFRANREDILNRVRALTDSAAYDKAVAVAGVYAAVVTDAGLDSVRSVAVSKQKQVSDSLRYHTLTETLRNTPESDPGTRLVLYTQLSALRPNNAAYRAARDRYQVRVDASRKKEEAWVSRVGPAPQPSAWDGTYLPVRKYLKQVMNDPESLKMDSCTAPLRSTEGWLIGCDYRGKNGFGGMIRQSNWFIVVQGEVVKMAPSDAYKQQ